MARSDRDRARPEPGLRTATDHDRTLAGRAGGAFFAAAGVLGLVASPFLGTWDAPQFVASNAVLAVISVSLLVAPWARLPPQTLFVIPVIGHAFFWTADALLPGNAQHFAPFLMLPHVYAGTFLRRGSSLALAPLSALAVSTIPPIRNLDTALFIALCVLVGELLAHVAHRARQSRYRVDAVLRATRELADAPDTAHAVEFLRHHAGRLLGGDVVSVHLADPTTPGVLDKNGTEERWRMHADGEPSGVGEVMDSGSTLFVPHALRSPVVSLRHLRASGCRSVLYVPLPGARAPIGALVIAWRRTRRRVSELDLEVVELLSADAGRVFERIARAEEMETRSLSDPLCGTGNRRRWEQRIDRLEPDDVVVIVDVDHFKTVNDTKGHPYGDAVLQALAAVLTAAARTGDDVCRIGGDEFGVVLAACGAAGARRYLDRVTTLWQGTGENTGFSHGHAVVTEGAAAVETVRAADQALYRAKATRERQPATATAEPRQPSRPAQ
ncbi:MAG: diguanylate cyclase [Actinomycetota bacterium]|nr:diguanylate cyclase [Actinomycetota bacterium]